MINHNSGSQTSKPDPGSEKHPLWTSSHERLNESMMLFETIPYGVIQQVPNNKMAFSNRGDYYNVATMFKWFDPQLDSLVRTYSRNLLSKASQATIRSAEEIDQF